MAGQKSAVCADTFDRQAFKIGAKFACMGKRQIGMVPALIIVVVTIAVMLYKEIEKRQIFPVVLKGMVVMGMKMGEQGRDHSQSFHHKAESPQE